MTDDAALALSRGLAAEFRRRLCGECLPRLGRCLDLLTEDQIRARPGPTGNSIANLLLHLEGNVRQWILSGIAGEPDHRDRPAEFAANPGGIGATGSALHASLTRTVEQAAAVVDGLGPEELLQVRSFQEGRFRESTLSAVVHVLEHFAGHSYQIYARTKQLTGRDLAFYDL